MLDFGGIDVHPAAQDEVDATIGQEQITVVVEPSEISDAEEVALPGLGGLLGSVVVLELRHPRHRRDVDQPGLADGQVVAGLVADGELDAGEGAADAPRLAQPLLG